MVCSNCGHPVGPDDEYCGGCGAYLTDAPVEETAPVQDDTWEVPYATGPPPTEPRRGPSTGLIAAAVAAVVLVALLLVWALRGDDEPTTATGTPTDQATSAPATSEPGTAGPTDAATATDTPTTPTQSPTEQAAPEEIELPGSAEQCGTAGAFTVYSGNDATSCPFAQNVGAAYAELGETTGPVTLSGVTSPVTGQSYDLTCDFTSPVRCTGGNNAVVYLASTG
jgi:cytoskeletal protein RodZ